MKPDYLDDYEDFDEIDDNDIYDFTEEKPKKQKKKNKVEKSEKMRFNLDFNLYSSKERRDFIAQQDLSKLSKRDLELCANYILYGKDDGGTSSVDRKEIQIKPKFNSYSKKEPISLDALMESPAFDESSLVQCATHYKNPKATIDREKLKDVPGFKDLWELIDRWQRIIDENSGKKPMSPDTPKLDKKQLYYLNHQLIDLRRQQYALKDSYAPTIKGKGNFLKYFDDPVTQQMNYEVFPRGVIRVPNAPEFVDPRTIKEPAVADDIFGKMEDLRKRRKWFFNFLDYSHVYQLIQNYYDIETYVETMPDSPLHNLLWTLDFYVEKADLTDQQLAIIELKKQRFLNKDISDKLYETLGVRHQENYISTIWSKCVQAIVDAAALNYDEWLSKDYPKAWKKCNCCGRILLRDPRNFVRKKKSTDGLTSNCKLCDRQKRLEMKLKKQRGEQSNDEN